MLGGLHITVDGRKVGGVEWESQKAQEFFAFLVCNRHGKSREELIEVLWPDIAVGLSRNAFHNNVYRTRRALYKTCVVLQEGRYRLNPEGRFGFDLEEFRNLSREATLAKPCSKKQLSLLTEANRRYRGEFLQGIDADWVIPITMEAERLYLSNLTRLAEVHASQGDCAAAVAVLERALAIDPTDVDTQELIVKLLVRSGSMAEARKRHEGFRRLMLAELGAEPPRDFPDLCVLAATPK